ncbi:MAG TPA: hypothetical protein EYP77_00785 [Anaerolineae bacterium]|nr:hypothetical protein [Anaerolineae bacterium]
MVEVHLYGKLRRYAPDPRPDRESVIRLEFQPGETVGAVLERLGISSDEIAHIFKNGALLTTCNSMAPWLRYQQAREGMPNCDLGLEVSVQDGDRLGLFGRNMPLLVV